MVFSAVVFQLHWRQSKHNFARCYIHGYTFQGTDCPYRVTTFLSDNTSLISCGYSSLRPFIPDFSSLKQSCLTLESWLLCFHRTDSLALMDVYAMAFESSPKYALITPASSWISFGVPSAIFTPYSKTATLSAVPITTFMSCSMRRNGYACIPHAFD